MKKLEELGISPAPWWYVHEDQNNRYWCQVFCKADERGMVNSVSVPPRCDLVTSVPDVAKESQARMLANARLIAAAPDLYKALRFAYGVIFQNWAYDTEDLMMIKAALAKAAGEEEKNG